MCLIFQICQTAVSYLHHIRIIEDARLADLGWDGTELYRVKNLWTDEEALTGNMLTSGNIKIFHSV